MTQVSPLRNSDFAVAQDSRIKRVISVAQNLKTTQIRVSREGLPIWWVQSRKACKSFDLHEIYWGGTAYIDLLKRVALKS